VLVDFCISSLVIICFVKSFYELNVRFFGPAVIARAGAQRSFHKGEATAKRTISACRVRWPHIQIARRRCAKRERCHARHASFGEQARRRRHFSVAFRHRHHVLLFAALASDHAKLTRRLALNARIGERW
jgi:hypothetical protein